MKMFRRINFIIGKPIEYFELGFKEGNQAEYSAASKLIFDRILELNNSVEYI